MKTSAIIEYIESCMSQKRRVHTYAVRDEARRLAEKYGADPEKAETASLYHDIFRGKPAEELNRYVRELGLDEKYIDNVSLAHGKIAAIIMERDYGIRDREVIDAVSYHTTGRENMTLLDKIVFLADAIEPNRDYPGVDRLRMLADTDLDLAVMESLRGTIGELERQEKFIDTDTLKALEYLKKERGPEMTTDTKAVAMKAAEILSNKKGRDILIIDLKEKASFADYFVMCSGGSLRQTDALADEIDDRFAQEGIPVRSIEGKGSSGWILLDYGDVIINVMTEEMRERYNIEKVWGDCTFITYEEGNEE